MKKTQLISLFVALILVLSLVQGATAGSPPPPPQGPRSADYDMHPPSKKAAAKVPAPGIGRLAAIPLPAYKHVRTFGILQEPYIEDTTHINLPWGLAVKGSQVFIADSYGNRVLIFNNDGSFDKQIGKAGINDYYTFGGNAITIRNIADVGVDADGNIWVVDREPAHVLKFVYNLVESKFEIALELGSQWDKGSANDQFESPAGIAFDSSGYVYISDGAPDAFKQPSNERIQVFTSAGVYHHTIGLGTTGTGDYQFNGNRRIAIDADNLLYVADAGNERVQIFDVTDMANKNVTYVATLGQTGVKGSGDDQFNNPSGVAVNSTHIFVADTWNNRVMIFDRGTRAFVAKIGTSSPNTGKGDYDFHHNFDVAVEEPVSGITNVYVTDFDNTRVQMYSFDASAVPPAATYVRTFGVTGVPYLTTGNRFNQPSGLAVDPQGNLYVVEEMGQRLIKLDANGTPLWTWGVPGIGALWNSGIPGFNDQHLNNPSDVAVRPSDGKVFITDRWNHRVQIFNPDGSHFSTLGYPSSEGDPPSPGTGNTQFNCPRGLGFGADSALYVADTCNHRVQKFDANLNYVATFGTTGVAGNDNTKFNSPQDVAVDRNGQVSVADAKNKRIQVFSPTGAYLRTIPFPSSVDGPLRLDVDASNNVYATGGWNKVVRVYNADGELRGQLDSTISEDPKDIHGIVGIAVNALGEVYLADYWDNARVQLFSWVTNQIFLPMIVK